MCIEGCCIDQVAMSCFMAQVADKGLLSRLHVFVEVREDRRGGRGRGRCFG
jgi:hypothetical protein